MDKPAGTDSPIIADLTYIFDDAVRSSIAAEAAFEDLDLGPVDTLDPEDLIRAYDKFFGTSPLSSPSSSPPASPVLTVTYSNDLSMNLELELEFNALYGMSSLSSDPPSFQPSRPTSPMQEWAPPPLPNHPIAKSSEMRRNKKKGHANRHRKRQGGASSARSKLNDVPQRRKALHSGGHNPYQLQRSQHTVGILWVHRKVGYGGEKVQGTQAGGVASPRRRQVHGASMEWRVRIWLIFIASLLMICRTSRAIVDKDGRIIAVLVGRPNDPGWRAVHRSAHVALQSARTRCRFLKKSKQHHRGDFPALTVGISYGGGQPVCNTFLHTLCETVTM